MPGNRFGLAIKRLRRRHSLTQAQLAERMNIDTVDQSYISKIEKGGIGRPLEDRVRAFARALDYDEEELLEIAGWRQRVIVAEEIGVPVIGRIPADSVRWTELERHESVRDVSVTADMIADARSPFALEVSGDCLQQVGIYHGDVVILDTPDGRVPQDRQLVAVRIGDEVTLKRWCVTSRGIELQDGTGRTVYCLDEHDDIEIIGLYLTFKPQAPR